MRDSGLAPDIPLGPFEGTLITAYAAGKTARLHARRDCSRLRADPISELKVPLNAASTGRMCAECARWGQWAPPGTALGMFLKVISAYELPYQLGSYAGSESDDSVTDKEIADAVAALRRGKYPSDEGIGDTDEEVEVDEDLWDAFRSALELRDSRIVPEWCSAVQSLLDAAGEVVRYPWLKPWASKRLDLKSRYAEMLRRKASQLLSPDALVAASGAHGMPMPELPVNDPAFAVLGGSSDVRSAIQTLWYEWKRQVSYGWLAPHEHGLLTYKLAERLGNKRKGRDELRTRAGELLNSWADAAVAASTGHGHEADQLVVATIRIADKERDGRRPPLIKQLTQWELGVLIMFTVTVDWGARTFLLKAPRVIAERMLSDDSTMSCSACSADPTDATAYEELLTTSVRTVLTEAGHSAFLPGVLDDTPVSQRQPVALSEVRALRQALDDRCQLFVVCSVANGVEVLPLAKVEERCKDDWSGVLVAEADDLPIALFAPHIGGATTVDANDENDVSSTRDWDDRHLSSEHPDFGEHLGDAVGERRLRWMHSNWPGGVRLVERDFRIFALARGVHDLRTLAYEGDSGVPAVSREVWLALLLVRDFPNLQPCRPRVPEDRWDGGLGLPLGVLADVQIYTTNADPKIMGKGHSPFCQHVRDRGVRHDDFLLTLEEVIRRSDLDWCSNCGGYAMRRLSDEQISYYRVAHRLLDIDQALMQELAGYGTQQVDLAGTETAFDEISKWLCGRHERWQIGDTWRVEEIMRELKDKADLLARYRHDGWPDSGSVVQLKPRR